MKRLGIVLLVLLLAAGLWAEEEKPLVSVGFLTDGYVIGNKDGGTVTAGQDVNLDVGPFFADLTFDWTKTLWDGDNTLAPAYVVGYSQAFGAFTPGIKLSGDQSWSVDGKAWTGDIFSDLEPSLDIAIGKVGANLYADLSFEEGYDVFQTFDGSLFANVGPAVFRAGVLYMTAQAVTDDVGYPNSPAAREGTNFYAKVSVEY